MQVAVTVINDYVTIGRVTTDSRRCELRWSKWTAVDALFILRTDIGLR